MPFTTNREFVKYARTVQGILRLLYLAREQYSNRVVYAMVQPCLANKKEYKVVVQGGVAKYIASIGTCCKGRAFATKDQLLKFAEHAVGILRDKSIHFIWQGTVRVDIMQTNSQQLIVNEFESLEACIYSNQDRNLLPAVEWMVEYWIKEIKKAIK